MTAKNGEGKRQRAPDAAGLQTPLAVFLINLDRSPERYAAMAEQLRRLKIPFRRVSAADEQELSEEELKKLSAPEQIKKNLGRQMTRGEIACCLSHLKVYEIIVKENIPAAVVLEDDAALNEDFAAALEGWRRMPGHCRALQLITGVPVTRAQKKLFSRIGNVRFPAGYVAARHCGAIAGGSYIIRRAYAEELLQTVFPITTTIDMTLFSWKSNRYIPWILHRKRKGGGGEIQSLGVHLRKFSLLRQERNRAIQEGYRSAGCDIRAKISRRSLGWTSRLCENLVKYSPLPLNRGRKLSVSDIASESPHLCCLRVALSCLALPGRNGEAGSSARKKRDAAQ